MPSPRTPTRRDFLRAALAGAAASVALPLRRAAAIGEGDRFRIAQIVYPGGWNPRPGALRRVLWEIDKRTSIDVSFDPVEVRLSDRELFRYPLLYLAGDRAMPAFPEDEIVRLRR